MIGLFKLLVDSWTVVTSCFPYFLSHELLWSHRWPLSVTQLQNTKPHTAHHTPPTPVLAPIGPHTPQTDIAFEQPNICNARVYGKNLLAMINRKTKLEAGKTALLDKKTEAYNIDYIYKNYEGLSLSYRLNKTHYDKGYIELNTQQCRICINYVDGLYCIECYRI